MSTEFRSVYLHGSLRRFGKHFRLAVGTPAEAVRALCCQLRGFRSALREGHYRVVTGAPGKRRDRGEDALSAGFSHAVHIIPVIAGAGGGKGIGIGLAIAGAALLLASGGLAAVGAWGLGLTVGTTTYSVSAGTIGLLGVALGLQGVSMLLAPKPKLEDGTLDSKRTESFLFGGSPDRPVAGRPVPVAIGTFRAPCIPVSVQLKNVRLA